MDDEWSAIRISSGTSIQNVVTSALNHLSNASNGPLILHTLPAKPHENGKLAKQKSSHAGLCKLISVVEIIKREFAEHQRQLRRNRKNNNGTDVALDKGKKRALEDGGDDDEEADDTTSNKENNDDQKKTLGLRLFQYNQLLNIESLDGQTTSNGQLVSKTSDKLDHATVEQDDEANRLLNEAIESHVVKNLKRPRKKHTPCMKITLVTERMPAFEKYLTSRNEDWTIQMPLKAKRVRQRRQKKSKLGEGLAEDATEGEGVTEDEGVPAGEAEKAQADGSMTEESSNERVTVTMLEQNSQ